jgi:uncharacterized coiled-coil DUF342 family protein
MNLLAQSNLNTQMSQGITEHNNELQRLENLYDQSQKDVTERNFQRRFTSLRSEIAALERELETHILRPSTRETIESTFNKLRGLNVRIKRLQEEYQAWLNRN